MKLMYLNRFLFYIEMSLQVHVMIKHNLRHRYIQVIFLLLLNVILSLP